MAKFRDYRSFPNPRGLENYRLPHVCFSCRKSFKLTKQATPRVSPQCSGELHALDRKFSAPRRADLKQWEKVRFLVERAFFFQPVYDKVSEGGRLPARYPRSLDEARRFVEAYAEQARRHPDDGQ